jgi:hypothetical protein
MMEVWNNGIMEEKKERVSNFGCWIPDSYFGFQVFRLTLNSPPLENNFDSFNENTRTNIQLGT